MNRKIWMRLMAVMLTALLCMSGTGTGWAAELGYAAELESSSELGSFAEPGSVGADQDIAMEALQEGTAAIFTVGEKTAAPGGKVEIPVHVTQNPGFAGALFELEYDDKALTLTEVARGKLLSNGSWNVSIEKHTVQWYDSTGNMADEGLLFTLKFAVAADAAVGDHGVNMSIKAENLTDYDFQNVPFEITNGKVTVVKDAPPDDDDDGKTVISLGSLSVKQGGDAEVRVRISENPGISLLSANILYDHSAMTLTSVEKGELLSRGNWSAGVDKGTVRWYDTAGDMKDNGLIFTLKFSVLENAPVGKYEVTLSMGEGDLSNHEAQKVPFIISEGQVSVEEPEPGPEPETKALITMGEATAKPGDFVEIPVNLTQNPGFAGLMAQVTYDSSVLELNYIQRGKLLEEGNWNTSLTNNTVQWYSTTADVTGTGLLFTLRFKILKNATPGKYIAGLNIRAENFVNYDIQKVPFSLTRGSVTVMGEEAVMVRSISLNPQVMRLAPGSTMMLSAVALPDDATDRVVILSSDNEAIATVSGNRFVKAVSVGETTVTATARDGSGVKASCKVIVEENPAIVHVEYVYLDDHEMKIVEGEKKTLTYRTDPLDATDQTVTWSNKYGNTDVATVDENGVVTGLKPGITYIQAVSRDGGKTDYCKVEVQKREESISFDTEDSVVEMLPGELKRLSLSRSRQYIYGVKWSVEAPNPKGCVTVKNGVVTAKKPGKATVTAVYRDEKAEFHINVHGNVPDNVVTSSGGMKVNATKSVNLSVGSAGKKVTVSLPKSLAGSEVIPEIRDEGVCSLSAGTPDANGSKVSYTVTPEDAGATWIIWTAYDGHNDEIQAYTKVIVKKPLKELDIEGSDSTLLVNAGECTRLVVTGTEKNTDTKELSFKSDEKGIKVSKSGCVIATAPGVSGTVTVKAGKVSAQIRIRSNPDTPERFISLNKTSLALSAPKGLKDKTTKLKVTVPKKKADQPKIDYSVLGLSPDIYAEDDGLIKVGSVAHPGCYTIVAIPTTGDYHPVYCELIVK